MLQRLCLIRDRIAPPPSGQGDDYGTAAREMRLLVEEDAMRDKPILIFANKQDLPNAMSVEEITEHLQLHTTLRARKWHVQGSCGTQGDGLKEGFAWLERHAFNLK